MSRRKNKALLSYYISPQSVTAEQFRAIRNNIEHVTKGKKPRIVVVTSPGSGEGKTMAAMNLAISRMRRGEKVLIIDANMKNPMIHELFNVKVSPGLTNVLAEQIALQEAIVTTGLGRLDILPFGTLLYNSMEMLDSEKMNDLLELASKLYDSVVIDTAPVLEVLDTNSLASKSDGVILVLNGGKTERELAFKAKRLLEFSAKAKIIGVILNRPATN